MFETTCVLPPQIKQYFDRLLLNNPIIGDNADKLKRVLGYIEKHLFKKCKSEKRMEKFNKMKAEFMEKYERAKDEEEVSKGSFQNKTQMPFYYIKITDKCDRAIFDGLRSKIRRVSIANWKDNEV